MAHHTPSMYRTRAFIVLLTATLLLILEQDERLFDLWFFAGSVWMYFLVLPLAVLAAMGVDPRTQGCVWRIGWPFSGRDTLLVAVGLMVLMLGLSFSSASQEYYLARMEGMGLPLFLLFIGAYYFAEEFFFRGYLLFGLREQFGEFAILLQAVPFALFHIGKPSLETLASFFVGLLFGHIAFRTGSFLPTFFLHWAIGGFLIVLIRWYALGG